MTAGICLATFCLLCSATANDASDGALRVQADVGRGPHFVGQGLEIRIAVEGLHKEPRIDLPPIPSADAWLIATDKRPITRSQIGSIVGEENLFVTRIRVVPRRAGTLQVPSIPVRFDDKAGRSPSLHVEILPVPAEGRPATFLGGVGRFESEASVSTHVVRVGQEFDLRITVAGPGAWGMTNPPELRRFDSLPLSLRIRPGQPLTSNEPPECTFVYHLRPTRSGEAILPPVSIASFDPSLSRFLTHVTKGVPIRVVAVSAFDPATVHAGTSASRAGRFTQSEWIACSLAGAVLAAVYAALHFVRRRLRLRRLARESAARRYAASLARSLASEAFLTNGPLGGEPVTAPSNGDLNRADRLAARRVSHMLIRYLELGADRPPGALTPEEAGAGVSQVSRSADLASKACRLITISDRVLYAETPIDSGASALHEQARALFDALGKVKTS